MAHRQEIKNQFQSYLDGSADAELTKTLFAYFDSREGSEHLSELVNEAFENGAEIDPVLLARVVPMADRVGLRLVQQIATPKAQRSKWKQSYSVIAVAASILLAIAILIRINGYLATKIKPGDVIAMDVLPGSNRATLTFSDGRKIDLTSAPTGSLSSEQGTQIEKTADGKIIYNGRGSTQINTITTPKGGQFQVRLPDGSEVWLNAASSISYATDLSNSKKRVVHLIGEAYFEVAKDPSRPFIVQTKDQQVQVLGTHFNVNSYSDEMRTITTLAEGSVRVTQQGKQVMLSPGQQSIGKGGALEVKSADMETAFAWKNGNLVFKSATLDEIFRQVQRWYDVNVVYEGKIQQRVFTGGIPRSSKLSVLLQILSDSGVKFEMKETPQGRTLIIHD